VDTANTKIYRRIFKDVYRQKRIWVNMLFTLVIFSTYEYTQESLAIAKLAPPFFMPKNGVVLNGVIVNLKVIILKYNGLLKFKNIFLLKELFFTSPQLKITLFKTVLLQLALMHFVDTILVNVKSKFIKREANVSTC